MLAFMVLGVRKCESFEWKVDQPLKGIDGLKRFVVVDRKKNMCVWLKL